MGFVCRTGKVFQLTGKEQHILSDPRVDQEGAVQLNYGSCLQNGKDVSIDLTRKAHYLKLAASQGSADAQSHYEVVLKNDEGVSKDLKLAACDLKLAADQDLTIDRNIVDALRSLKRSAATGNLDGQFAFAITIACMPEQGMAGICKQAEELLSISLLVRNCPSTQPI
jgi:TPR repeat protein